LIQGNSIHEVIAAFASGNKEERGKWRKIISARQHPGNPFETTDLFQNTPILKTSLQIQFIST